MARRPVRAMRQQQLVGNGADDDAGHDQYVDVGVGQRALLPRVGRMRDALLRAVAPVSK